MADIKISEMETASIINNEDNIELSQASGSGFVSFKTNILTLAQKIASAINFTNALQTTNKTLTGAINEVAQSGGSGGHTILNDSGTELAQEDDLQFKGIYTHDDSVNGKTVAEVYREMTLAQFNQLSASEKLGFIRITDDNSVCDSTEVTYDSNNTVKQKIDAINLTAGGTITDDLNIKKSNGLGLVSIGKGSNSSEYGVLQLYDENSHFGNIRLTEDIEANRTYRLPNKSGTLATTVDLPTYKRLLNTSSVSFYCPKDCMGFLLCRAYSGSGDLNCTMIPFGVASGSAWVDNIAISGGITKPSASYNSTNGVITFTWGSAQNIFVSIYFAPMQ